MTRKKHIKRLLLHDAIAQNNSDAASASTSGGFKPSCVNEAASQKSSDPDGAKRFRSATPLQSLLTSRCGPGNGFHTKNSEGFFSIRMLQSGNIGELNGQESEMNIETGTLNAEVI